MTSRSDPRRKPVELPRTTLVRNRAGVLLPELIISMLLLGTAAAVMTALMVSVAAQRQAAEQRQVALLLAENLLDEFLAAPWSETTQENFSRRLAEFSADDQMLPTRLPGLERLVSVVEWPEDSARQVTVEFRWRNRAGDFTTPVRLSGWTFAPAEKTL
jgi:type II secretory pathway pseudopilin PulG